mgnify:CR=1 FL=1
MPSKLIIGVRPTLTSLSKDRVFRPGYYDPFSERRVYTNQPPAHFRPMVDTIFPGKTLVVPIYMDRQGRLDQLSREFIAEHNADLQQNSAPAAESE